MTAEDAGADSSADDDFSRDEERVLVYLVQHGCLKPSGAKRWEAIERDLAGKIPDLDGVFRALLNKQAIGRTKKVEGSHGHYYANTKVLHYLRERGLWSPGRIHHL